MMRALAGILAVAGAGYAAFVALLYGTQDRILYPRTRSFVASPADRGWHYEDVHLQTDDGERLHGWWIPAEEERGALLFFHGNAGNISGRLDSIEQFRRLGLSVLIVGYRGYGQSSGAPTEEGLYRDADAAWRHLTEERGYASNQIVVFGRSLGSGPATWLANRCAPSALILESPFTSVPDAAARRFPFVPVRHLARSRFDNESRIARIEMPLLIIHSPQDRVIPFEHGQQLYEEAHDPKAFLEIEGGHNDGFLVSSARYLRGIDRFLRAHFDAPSDT